MRPAVALACLALAGCVTPAMPADQMVLRAEHRDERVVDASVGDLARCFARTAPRQSSLGTPMDAMRIFEDRGFAEYQVGQGNYYNAMVRFDADGPGRTKVAAFSNLAPSALHGLSVPTLMGYVDTCASQLARAT